MKTLLRTSLIVLLSFSLLSYCKAQDKQEPSVFDIVPDRFLLAILTPKVGELEPKLRKLSKQAYPDQLDLTSGVIKDFYENAGFDLSVSKFNRVLDRSRGGGLFFDELEFNPIRVLPIKDSEKLSEYLQVDSAELTAGEILKTAQKKSVRFSDGRLYVAQNEFDHDPTRLKTRRKLRPLRSRISETEQDLKTSDLIVLVDSELYKLLKGFFPTFDLSKFNMTKDEVDEGFLGLVKHAEKALNLLTVGVNLKDGIRLKTSFHFTEINKEKTNALIESMRGGDGIPNLDGLPDHQVIAAFAVKGSGMQNAVAAKSILSMIVKRISPNDEIMSAKNKTIFYQSFTKLWKKMNGTRLGVYRLEEPEDADEHAKWAAKQTGRLGAVTVFDIDDPEAFLNELPELVKFTNEAANSNATAKQLMPISIEYKKSVATIAGHRVDELVVNTERLSKESRWRFQYLFGKEARRFKLVPLNNHLLLYVGTSTKRLEETIANLKSGEKGLARHPLILKNYKQIDSRRKIEFHFSSPNLYDLYDFDTNVKKYTPADDMSVVSFTIDPKRVGMDTWLPAKEIDQAGELFFIFSRLF